MIHPSNLSQCHGPQESHWQLRPDVRPKTGTTRYKGRNESFEFIYPLKRGSRRGVHSFIHAHIFFIFKHSRARIIFRKFMLLRDKYLANKEIKHLSEKDSNFYILTESRSKVGQFSYQTHLSRASQTTISNFSFTQAGISFSYSLRTLNIVRNFKISMIHP